MAESNLEYPRSFFYSLSRISLKDSAVNSFLADGLYYKLNICKACENLIHYAVPNREMISCPFSTIMSNVRSRSFCVVSLLGTAKAVCFLLNSSDFYRFLCNWWTARIVGFFSFACCSFNWHLLWCFAKLEASFVSPQIGHSFFPTSFLIFFLIILAIWPAWSTASSLDDYYCWASSASIDFGGSIINCGVVHFSL